MTNGGSSGITFEEFAVRNNTSGMVSCPSVFRFDCAMVFGAGGSNGGGVGARVVGGDSTIHLKSCEVAHNTAISTC